MQVVKASDDLPLLDLLSRMTRALATNAGMLCKSVAVWTVADAVVYSRGYMCGNSANITGQREMINAQWLCCDMFMPNAPSAASPPLPPNNYSPQRYPPFAPNFPQWPSIPPPRPPVRSGDVIRGLVSGATEKRRVSLSQRVPAHRRLPQPAPPGPPPSPPLPPPNPPRPPAPTAPGVDPTMCGFSMLGYACARNIGNVLLHWTMCVLDVSCCEGALKQGKLIVHAFAAHSCGSPSCVRVVSGPPHTRAEAPSRRR